MNRDSLEDVIKHVLLGLENEGSIVITESVVNPIAEKVASAARSTILGERLEGYISMPELEGIISVLLHAAENKDFFDWEMPILCGLESTEVREIALRLKRDAGI